MPGGPSTSPAPLTVAVDATSLLGRPTGIGGFTAGLLAGLAGRSDVEPSAFAVSWRRREGIEALLPRGVPARHRGDNAGGGGTGGRGRGGCHRDRSEDGG